MSELKWIFFLLVCLSVIGKIGVSFLDFEKLKIELFELWF